VLPFGRENAMIIKTTAHYTAFGALDRNGQAYVALRAKEGGEPEAAIRLPANATLIHAEQRAAEINERGEIVLRSETWVEPKDVPSLFADPG